MLAKKRGQSTLEYALIIAVVVAALLAINFYMRRGVTGRLKESTDQIGRQFQPDTFADAWKNESAGQTVVTENRNTADGSTTSTTSAGEVATRGEHSQWGAAPGTYY